jgi:glutamine cyclotransferase
VLFLGGCHSWGEVTTTPIPTATPSTATAGASPTSAASPIATVPAATSVATEDASPTTPVTPGEPRHYNYRIVNSYPHDPTAFTQGLDFADGILYEGTGLNGQSSLRRVDLETGEVLQRVDLIEDHFGEGIVVVGDVIYQLTWQSQLALVYDRQSFEQIDSHTYPTEGWGLTSDGQRLIMSDGSSTLFFRDPETFAELRRVEVLDGDEPVTRLNELEWVNGEVWANVWQTDLIVRIDPATGIVVGWIDLTGLLQPSDQGTNQVDVLNGIAVDETTGRIFVTGKLWPVMYEIELVEQ